MLIERLKLLNRENAEFELVHQAAAHVEKMVAMQAQKSLQLSVKELEEIDRDVKSRKIDLEKRKTVTVKLGSRILQVKTEDIARYRIIKGLGVSLITRYIFKEGDLQRLNQAKNGKMLDFEMTKHPITFQFKELNVAAKSLRTPGKDSFVCTARDIREFPDIVDPGFYYWPTIDSHLTPKIILLLSNYLALPGLSSNQSGALPDEVSAIIERIKQFIVSQLITPETGIINQAIIQHAVDTSVNEKITLLQRAIGQFLISNKDEIYSIEDMLWQLTNKNDQLFTSEDNENFKNLRLHPVFKYYEYKTLLKFLLIDPEVYHCIAELQIRQDEKFGQTTLRLEAANDDIARRNEIESVLLDMPEFQAFITEHGDDVFKQIEQELGDLKEKYVSKLAHKPFYQRLVNAINLENIHQRFTELRGIINEPDADNNVSSPFTIM